MGDAQRYPRRIAELKRQRDYYQELSVDNARTANEAVQEVVRKDDALDEILELLRPWPEDAEGRFGEIRRIARRGRG